jgi:hypothetical protein
MLQKSMQRLSKEKGLQQVRLFGKILGHASDYYVAEVPNIDGAVEEKNEGEEEGEGE